MKCYVDSSVVLRYLLTESRDFERVREFDHVGTSELLYIECHRVIQRYRLDGAVTDSQLEEATTYLNELYDSLHVFDMDSNIKRRASESFPTIIGTLDAIHLSTAKLWADQGSEPLIVFTLDSQMRTCAQAMGMHAV